MEKVGEILQHWLKQQRLETRFYQYTIFQKWRELVGDLNASRSQPGALWGSVLTVIVANSTWANHLSFLREQIIEKINAAFGKTIVQRIRFITGPLQPWMSPPTPFAKSITRVELSPQLVEEIEREIAGVQDAELRAAIKQARLSQLRRQLLIKKGAGIIT